MKQKTITILGEEVKIDFNMAVEIAYEEISGKPFNVEDLKTQTASIALYMAAIITSNPDTTITVERLMKEASGQEIGLLSQTIINAMVEWMAIPSVIKEEQPKNDADKKEKEDDENKKN